MTGDLYLKIDRNRARFLGCDDLTPGTGFSLVLGNIRNQLQFQKAPLGQVRDQRPLTFETSHGLLIKTRNQDICHIGFRNSSPIIRIYKNIEMNNNRLLYLDNPVYPHEAIPKHYVDDKFANLAFLIYEGHIPPLERSMSKTGFIASCSSRYSPFNDAWFAFSTRSEWRSAVNEGVGAWIQISCPLPVRIWKIRLTGPEQNENRITSWKLGGGSDGSELTDIYTSRPDDVDTLGSSMKEFLVETDRAYNVYRLTVRSIEEGSTTTGLSYFQIYIKSYYSYAG